MRTKMNNFNITEVVRQKSPMQSIVRQVPVQREDEYLVNAKREQIIDYLDNGGDINKNFIDSNGNNIGNLLFINQNKEALIELINRGIDINYRDYKGRNCLWFIKENEVWDNLISKGININQQTKDYYYEKTVLMDAINSRNYDKAEILINNNVDLNIEDRTGNNIIFQFPSDEKLFNLIKNKKIKYHNDISHILCLTESINIAKFLIEEKGVDVNKTYKGMGAGDLEVTALMLNTNIDVSKLLISYGADVNKLDSFGRNALFYNIFKNIQANTQWENMYERAKLLLENNIDINKTEKTGENVLFYLFNEKLLQLYKKYNIDMECLDKNGNNAITQSRDIGKAELLYQYGCSIQRKFRQYEVFEVGQWAKEMHQQISQAKKEKKILEKTIQSKVESTVKKRL